MWAHVLKCLYVGMHRRTGIWACVQTLTHKGAHMQAFICGGTYMHRYVNPLISLPIPWSVATVPHKWVDCLNLLFIEGWVICSFSCTCWTSHCWQLLLYIARVKLPCDLSLWSLEEELSPSGLSRAGSSRISNLAQILKDLASQRATQLDLVYIQHFRNSPPNTVTSDPQQLLLPGPQQCFKVLYRYKIVH